MSTYGLPAEITAQTLFDTCATHLITQGRPSLMLNDRGEETGVCAYRGKDGMACAVGCLIPDDRYDASVEEKTVEHDVLIKAMPEIIPHKALLYDLQRAHDFGTSIVNGIFDRTALFKKLALIALDHRLNEDVLKALDKAEA